MNDRGGSDGEVTRTSSAERRPKKAVRPIRECVHRPKAIEITMATAIALYLSEIDAEQSGQESPLADLRQLVRPAGSRPLRGAAAFEVTETILRVHLEGELGGDSARLIEDPSIWEALIRSRRAAGYAEHYLALILRTVRSLGDYAVTIGAAARNAARMISADVLPMDVCRDEQRTAETVLNAYQLVRLLRSPEVPLYRRAFYAAQGLGCMRMSEAIGLCEADLDRTSDKLWRVHLHRQRYRTRGFSALKDRWPRWVPVHPLWARLLGAHLEETHFARQNRDGDVPLLAAFDQRRARPQHIQWWTASAAYRWLEEDLRAAGVHDHEKFARSPHTLRHTACSLYKNAGADDLAISFLSHPRSSAKLRGGIRS